MAEPKQPNPKFHGVMIDVNHVFPTIINITDGKPEDVNKPIVIYDLDGTLFDHSHRVHHANAMDFDEYRKTIHKDEPHWEVIKNLIEHHQGGAVIILLTGRSDDLIAPTIRQIHQAGFQDHVSSLMMRSKYYDGSVLEHKLNAMNLLVQDGSVLAGVVDDDPEVREMAQSLGLEAFDPADIIRIEKEREHTPQIVTDPNAPRREVRSAGGIILSGG